MSQTSLNQLVRAEIARIAAANGTDARVLEGFAEFVIKNYKKKDKTSTKVSTKGKKPPSLALSKLKAAVYQYSKLKTQRNYDGLAPSKWRRMGWTS